jgi:hypothetical protein
VNRTLGAVAVLLLGAVAVACQPEPGPPAGPQPRRVAVYGDSLLHSSAPVWRTSIEEQLPDWNLLERALWGSAACDHLDQMADDAHEGWNVRVVVIAFYGNAVTPCARGQRVEDRYRWDLTLAVDLWQERGARVVLVVPPGPVDSEPYSPAGRAALAGARDRRVQLVDTTGAFVDTETGRFAAELDGVAVRSPDGVHLCDHESLGEIVCASDDAGANRYGQPIAAAVVAEARLVK